MAGKASPDVTRGCRAAALGRAETGKEMVGSDVDSICIEKHMLGLLESESIRLTVPVTCEVVRC